MDKIVTALENQFNGESCPVIMSVPNGLISVPDINPKALGKATKIEIKEEF